MHLCTLYELYLADFQILILISLCVNDKKKLKNININIKYKNITNVKLVIFSYFLKYFTIDLYNNIPMRQ